MSTPKKAVSVPTSTDPERVQVFAEYVDAETGEKVDGPHRVVRDHGVVRVTYTEPAEEPTESTQVVAVTRPTREDPEPPDDASGARRRGSQCR